MASCDPIESPSGRACDDSTKRCRARMASAMALACGLVVIGRRMRRGVELAEQLFDPVLSGNRFVVVKGQFGGPLEPQAGADLAAQEPGGARQRAFGATAALLVAERRVVDVRLLQIGADPHPCQRHEPDA